MKFRFSASCLFVLLWSSLAIAEDRVKITAPSPISKVYSEADMRLQLATIPDIKTQCKGDECVLESLFDDRVQQLGVRLAIAAFEAYPELIKKVSSFEFDVAEKAQPGITSSASGTVIIFRGTQTLELEEPALAFLMAREMGHVISQHHDENSATRIMLSVAAGILFPALHLFSGTTTAAQATSSVTSSTTFAATAASTATSYVGSKLMLDNLKPNQVNEADKVALNLLEKLGWGAHDISLALESSKKTYGDSVWADDLRRSLDHVRTMDAVAQSVEYSLTDAGPVNLHETKEEASAVSSEPESSVETGVEATEPATPADTPSAEPAKTETAPPLATLPIAPPAPESINVELAVSENSVGDNTTATGHNPKIEEKPIKLQAAGILTTPNLVMKKKPTAGFPSKGAKKSGATKPNTKKKPASVPKQRGAVGKVQPKKAGVSGKGKAVKPVKKSVPPKTSKPAAKPKKAPQQF